MLAELDAEALVRRGVMTGGETLHHRPREERQPVELGEVFGGKEVGKFGHSYFGLRIAVADCGLRIKRGARKTPVKGESYIAGIGSGEKTPGTTVLLHRLHSSRLTRAVTN